MTTEFKMPEQEPAYHLKQYGTVSKEQMERYIKTGDIKETSPQPREWQELSEDEINNAFRAAARNADGADSFRQAAYKMFSAALRAKNGG